MTARQSIPSPNRAEMPVHRRSAARSNKAALFEILKDVGEVERLFLIIKAQGEY